MRVCLCARGVGGGGYVKRACTWCNTSIKEKVSLSVKGLYTGGGGYSTKNIVKSLKGFKK